MHVGQHVDLSLIHCHGELGQFGPELIGHLAPLRLGRGRIVLGKGSGDEGGSDTAPWRPAWANRLRMVCTRQRCQVACSSLATAAFSPSCASEIASLTPRRPRRARDRRNSVQNVSASEAPTVIPSISRRPSSLTPTAMITATDMMRPAWRTLT